MRFESEKKDGYSRVEVALKLKETIAKKARDRQSCGQGGILLPEILPGGSKGDTRDEIGSLAGVSTGNVSKVEYIQSHAPEKKEWWWRWINMVERASNPRISVDPDYH